MLWPPPLGDGGRCALEGIASALPKVQPRSRWRMELQSRPDGVLVINDAYNANPDSMRAAIEALAELGRARRGGHTWAVLGDMLELGAMSSAEHANLGRFGGPSGVSWLIAVGRHAQDVVDAAIDAGLPAERAVIASSKPEATQRVLDGLAPADVVLVKASRGLALDTVAEEILRQDRPVTSPGAGVPPLKTIVLAGSIALLGTLLGTRLAIRVLVRRAMAN